MGKITYEEYKEAQLLINRYEYQENPVVQVSVTYEGTIVSCVHVPAAWSIETIKEAIEGGVPYNFSRDDEDDIRCKKIIELIVNGDVIDL